MHMWIRVHVSLLREILRSQSQRYAEWHAHVRKWSLDEWQQAERELIRERGIWGPKRQSSLDKYALDLTEGPCRVRKKLLHDADFYHRYPYRPALDAPEAKAQRAKVAISRDARAYYEQMRRRRFYTMDERIVDHAVVKSAAANASLIASTLSASSSSGGGDEAAAAAQGGVFDSSAELNLSMISRMLRKNVAIKQAAATNETFTNGNDEAESANGGGGGEQPLADEREAEGDDEDNEEEADGGGGREAESSTASNEALANSETFSSSSAAAAAAASSSERSPTTTSAAKSAPRVAAAKGGDLRPAPQLQPSTTLKTSSIGPEPDYQTL